MAGVLGSETREGCFPSMTWDVHHPPPVSRHNSNIQIQVFSPTLKSEKEEKA